MCVLCRPIFTRLPCEVNLLGCAIDQGNARLLQGLAERAADEDHADDR